MKESMQKFVIHGLPRSGTTWVGEIFNSSPNVCYRYQPLFSYALKDYLTDTSGLNDILRFYDELLCSSDDFLLQTEARQIGRLPQFEKDTITHIGYKEVRYHNILPNLVRQDEDIKCILVLRNPLSVINSWLNAPREFRGDLGWSRLDEWRHAHKKNLNRPEEFNGYEKWKEASLLFHYLAQQYPERVMVLRYDALLMSPVAQLKQAFDFLRLDYTEQTNQFLSGGECSDGDAYSVVREGQTDDKWKAQLEPEIVDEIRMDLKGGVLEYLTC